MKFEFKDKNIILGVSGGIAAYKSVELLRLLIKAEAQVRVVMTENAGWFVGPLTFKALSGKPVCMGLFENQEDASIRHIDWAQEADAVVIAPATANMIGKLANGIADDALSTLMMATTCPVCVCPSMNTHMYESKPVQRNLEILKEDGVLIIEPDAGELACGTTGPGRLPEPVEIFEQMRSHLTEKDLAGRHILVTAGPTREPIDPVRYISNPSSGKMGYAVARAARDRGAGVVLVSGPSGLADPSHVEVIRVNTAAEMADQVFERFDRCDVVIKTAAVSDYRPSDTAEHKIKKIEDETTVTLHKTQDILKELGARKKNQILIGFAAESQDLEKNASQKLEAKNLDMIVGNLINSPASGFCSDTNRVTLFFRDGTREKMPEMTKDDVAHLILDRLMDLGNTTP